MKLGFQTFKHSLYIFNVDKNESHSCIILQDYLIIIAHFHNLVFY